MTRTGSLISASIIAFSIAVAAFLPYYGKSRRIYLERPRIYFIAQPQMAYDVWAGNGVRGRTLLQVGRRLSSNDTKETTLSEDNYVYLAIQSGIVRKVYHAVPSALWPKVQGRLSSEAGFRRSGDVFRTATEGAPLDVLKINDIPRLKERVLVNIQGDTLTGDDIVFLLDLLSSGRLGSDLVTVSGTLPDDAPDDAIERLSALYEKNI